MRTGGGRVPTFAVLSVPPAAHTNTKTSAPSCFATDGADYVCHLLALVAVSFEVMDSVPAQ